MSERSASVDTDETRTVKIYCPDCDWTKTVKADGPVSESRTDLSTARHLAEGDARYHAAEANHFEDERHNPMLFTASGALRLERDGDTSEFVR